MYTTSILPENLREWSYYKNKLPLFLQNSYGFLGHFKIWYDLLTGDNHDGLADKFDIILYLLDIFDNDYLDYIGNLEGSGAEDSEQIFELLNNANFGEGSVGVSLEEDIAEILNDHLFGENAVAPQFPSNTYGDTSDILDKLGLLFGVSRKFSCTYKNNDAEIVTEEISLDNKDFLILIKCQIIKNYCEGSYEQIQSYYENAGMNVFMKNDDVPASLKIYLLSFGDDPYSQNVRKMFLAGLLNIESMGISYVYIEADIGDVFKWDGLGVNEVWDVGVWAE